MNEIREAIRRFRQMPWSTLGIILILALGTGANTAVVAVAYGILFRPLPYREASRLAVIEWPLPLQELDEWRRSLRTVDGLAGFASATHAIRGLGEPRIVATAFVTRDFFDVLGVTPVIGRTFDSNARTPVVVVSARFLETAGIDPASAIERPVRIAEGAFTVAGVVPAGVAIPSERVDVWVPADAAPPIPIAGGDARRYTMLGRLRPDVSLTQLRDDASRAGREVTPIQGRKPAAGPVTIVPVDERLSAAARPIVRALVIAAGLVLLVACANVTSLLLSRAAARERDTAVRVALGASTGRVLKGVLTESLLLAFTASALGVAAAMVGVRVLRTQAATLLPRLGDVRVDLPILGLALASAVAVALLCTLLPAWTSARRGLGPLLRQSGPARRTGRRIAGGLVSTQIAASIVILVASVLLDRTIVRLLAVDDGIDARQVLTMRLMLGERSLLRPGDRQAFVDDLLREVASIPAVESAGIGSALPPHTAQVEMAIRVVNGPRDETQMMSLVAIQGDYFGALGARVVSGRAFTDNERPGGAASIVLTRMVAAHLFADREAAGLQVPNTVPGFGQVRPTVVGVVDDVRYTGLAGASRGSLYVPWNRLPLGAVYLVVRTRTAPMVVAPAIRVTIQRLDPAQPIAEIQTLEDALQSSIADRRLHAMLASSFGTLGFIVALSGLVAALSRTVLARRQEIAIRIALGASRRQTMELVMRHAATLVAIGVAIGLLLAAAAGRGLAAHLFGVTAYDPVTFGAVALVTTLVALTASAVPAYRATRLDPNVLLRAE